uniref:Uncharacterized protein n=1 Tax=Rhizophora mucronata TaxID=61149 RepID=A0A2P2QRH3_RHIMU
MPFWEVLFLYVFFGYESKRVFDLLFQF